MADSAANNPQQGDSTSRKRLCPDLSTDDLIRQAQQLAGETGQSDPSRVFPPIIEKYISECLKQLQSLMRAHHTCKHGIRRMEELAKGNMVCKPFRFTMSEVWLHDEAEKKRVNAELREVMEQMKRGMHEVLYKAKQRDLELIGAQISSWLDRSRIGVFTHIQAYNTLVPQTRTEDGARDATAPSSFASFVEDLQSALKTRMDNTLSTGMLDEINKFIEWRMADERRIQLQDEKRQQREAAQADAEMLPAEEGVSEITRRVVAEELKKLNIKELMHEIRRLSGGAVGGTGTGGAKPKKGKRGSNDSPPRSDPKPRTPTPRHNNSSGTREHGAAPTRAHMQPPSAPFGARPAHTTPANGRRRGPGWGGNRRGGTGHGGGARAGLNGNGNGQQGMPTGAHHHHAFFPPAHAYMQPFPPYPFQPPPPPFHHPIQHFPSHFLPMEPPGPAPRP
jgi:hypothetical protein